MKLSKDARKAANSLFLGSFTNGRLDDQKVRTVVTQLIARKPRNYREILQAYQRSVRLDVEKRQAHVETAAELEGPAQDNVRKTLAAKYGDDLDIRFKVTPELLGGLRIKVGSDVWDSSVQARLRTLEQELVHA